MVSFVFNLSPEFAIWEAISDALLGLAEVVAAAAILGGLIALLGPISVRRGSRSPDREGGIARGGKEGTPDRAHSL